MCLSHDTHMHTHQTLPLTCHSMDHHAPVREEGKEEEEEEEEEQEEETITLFTQIL